MISIKSLIKGGGFTGGGKIARSPNHKLLYHIFNTFYSTADGTAAKGLVTTTIVIIIVVIAICVVALLVCLVVCCKRRKRANQQQSRPEAETLTPDAERPSSSAPSAPPAYHLEMAPTAATEALPSYDEVAASPNRFKSRSSFSRISSIFRKNNGQQNI